MDRAPLHATAPAPTKRTYVLQISQAFISATLGDKPNHRPAVVPPTRSNVGMRTTQASTPPRQHDRSDP